MSKEAEEKEENCIDRIYNEVEKDYGEGVLIDGNSLVADAPQIIPWSPSLDIITSGGIEEGSWVGITGNPKLGKTTCALSFAANAQKPEYGSRPIYYDKVEGRLSITHLKGIQGLDLSKGRFNVIQSTEKKILTTQDRLAILTSIIRTVPKAVVIIDSISAYCDEKEQNDGVGTETRGGGAKLFSQFCRIMNQTVPVNKTIVIGITHLISNTSGFGATHIERAARMWLYQKDYDLKAIKRTPLKVGEDTVGLEVEWVCNTSKNGPPGMKISSYIRFGVGVDKVYELINFASQANLIKKAGAWFTLNFLLKDEYKHLLNGKEPPRFQGTEKLYTFLKENIQLAKLLEKEVLAISSNLVGTTSGD